MSPGQYIVRRANVDDLAVLRGLWQLEQLPGYELEKRVTEFHVVARPDGVVMGAVGFLLAGQQALVHSLAFASAGQQAEGWPPLWEHLLALARSQNVVRLWRRGRGAPCWEEAGFQTPTPGQLKKLPPAFGAPQNAWQVFTLRDEAALSEAVEKEFEALHSAQQEQIQRLARQAAIWKLLGWVIAALFFIGAGWMLVVLLRSAPRQNLR